MTEREPDAMPPDPARVAIDPRIEFSKRDVGGRTTFVAHDPARGKFFQFGPEEYHVASLLDGQRTLTDLIPVLERDGIQWSPKEVAEFISRLVASGLATTSDNSPKTPADAPAQPPSTSWMMRLARGLSLVVSQRIPLIDGHPIASKLESRVGFVFSGIGIVYWLGLVCSALMIMAFHRHQFADEFRRLFDPNIWLVLLLMWIVAKVIHELGHAIAACYHRVHVGKIGIMFFFLAPLAFVDVTDAWKLKSRWSRVQIALAGVYLELAAAAIAVWAWWMLPDGLPRHLAAQFFIVAGPATLLVNANPLLRLDGYYVLSDITEIPNLRMHGRSQLTAALERFLMKMPSDPPLLSGWQRTFATVHAACSVMFQIIWMSGLILAASIWAEGLGILLAVAALLLWAVLPLSRWVVKVWTLHPGEKWNLNPQRKNLLLYASLVLMTLNQVFSANSPFDRRVPVVVRFHDEQIARAPVDAFVQAVYVTRNQRVARGTLLMELDDPELRIHREKIADDLQIATHRSIQFRRKGELSRSAAETENAASLRRQLLELDEQIDGLSVVAEREGLVVAADIENMEGRFIKQGEELLRVCDPQEKELLASVGETDMQAYQLAAQRGVPAEIRLRGGKTIAATPAPLRPRARRSLSHPALAATAGGPLPVEPSPEQDEEVRVIEPQLESLTRLDPVTSTELHAGQVGMMSVSDNRSLFARLWHSVAPD